MEVPFVLHVVSYEGRWHVVWDGDDVAVTRTEACAVQVAQKAASRDCPSRVLVHGQDGLVRQEFTYNKERHPPG